MAKFNLTAVRQVAKQNSKNNSAPHPVFNPQQVRSRGEDGKAQARAHNAQLRKLDENLGPTRGGRGD